MTSPSQTSTYIRISLVVHWSISIPFQRKILPASFFDPNFSHDPLSILALKMLLKYYLFFANPNPNPNISYSNTNPNPKK